MKATSRILLILRRLAHKRGATVAQLAEWGQCDPRTARRALVAIRKAGFRLTRTVDKLAEHGGQAARDAILSGNVKFTVDDAKTINT